MKRNLFIYTLISFLVWPFLTLIVSLVNYKDRSFRYVIPLFVGLLSVTFILIPGYDAHSLVIAFKDTKINTVSIWESIFNRFSGIEGGGVELYIFLITLFLKLFIIDDPILFLLFQGIFISVFIVLFLTRLYQIFDSSNNKSLVVKIYIFFLILYISPITALNGRFWTAYWVFIYFILMYIIFLNPKYLLFSFFSIFIHQGFIFTILISSVYLVTYKILGRYQLYYLLVILSFIYSSLGLQLFNESAFLVPESYSNKISSYSLDDPSKLTLFNPETSWFISLQYPVLFYSFLISLFYFRFISRLHFSKYSEHLYLYILLFLSFCNFVSSVPSLGGRYEIILLALILLLFLLLAFDNKIKTFSFPFIVSFIGLAFRGIISFRQDSDEIYGFIWGLAPYINFYYYSNYNLTLFFKNFPRL